MAETGDDCYFYYYSTCAKGDTCPFRHQPAAFGCEMTCHLWERGRCFKKACNFRHMVIEKERNTIPCFWESQPMGCTKSNCPFLHTKPRLSGLPPPPVMASTGMPVHSSANIAALHNNMRPPNPQMGPMNPQGSRGTAPARPPMYNGPSMPYSQAPYMSGPRPMGYEGFIPGGQPSLMMYPMQNSMQYPGVVPPGMMPNMMKQPRGNFPCNDSTGRRDHYDDESYDYTSSDYSDVSISDDENDRRSRPKDYSHRSVRSPRHQSSRREVRQSNSTRDKRSETSRSSREKDRKYDRRKERVHRADKEKEKSRSKDVTSSPSKSRKTSGGKDSTNERKKDDKSPEKEKSEKESTEGDIKVKTLEEILREKALKNLHERTAQKKKAQMEAEKNANTNNEDERNADSPEPVIKSVVSVSKTDPPTTSPKETPETGDGSLITKTKTDLEKKVQLPRTAKTIIRSIIENDSQLLSTETASKKLVRKIVIGSDDNNPSQKPNISTKESNKEASKELTASGVTAIKVKTLEEIKKEKQNRKELETKDKDLISEGITLVSENKQVVGGGKNMFVNAKPLKGRKISIKKKSDGNTAATSSVLKPGGKGLVKKRLCKAGNNVLKKEKDEGLKDDNQSKAETNETSAEKSKNIIVKSFDEIIKEKRERQKREGQAEQQEKTPTKQATTAVIRTKKPTIVRRKDTDKPEVQQAEPKKFTSRKLKIVRQQGNQSKISSSADVKESSVESSSLPASPSQSEASPLTFHEPGTSMSDAQLVSSNPPLTDQPIPGESNRETGNQTSLSYVGSTALENNKSECIEDNAADDDDDDKADGEDYGEDDDDASNDDDDDGEDDDDDGGDQDDDDDGGDQDDDDDESWQHEELPAVPMDTPILEGPTLRTFPSETPKTEAVIHIPGTSNLVGHQTTSPTKRPRTSLEELFGVPCDEDGSRLAQKPQLQDEEEEDVSPAKRVKTYQDPYQAIVQAVNRELSKKEDDFDIDLELEEEIANLSPGRPHDDSHEGYNEDDLLLELDEMIND